jgi:aminoglycoside 3-N-acetyltransferase
MAGCMFGYRDLILALREVGAEPATPTLVIGPAQSPEDLRGGASALFSAVRTTFPTFLTPTFTYQTMLVPPVGPDDNGLDYAAESKTSGEAEFFRAGLRSSPEVGPLAEMVRCAPGAVRSMHPILSFAGINVRSFLEAQTLEAPLGAVDALARAGGDVVLVGADSSANIAIHLAEQHAGRKQFVRWALTPSGVAECVAFPGCSFGFSALSSRLTGIEREGLVGGRFSIRRMPLRDLLHETTAWIREDPRALLCDRPSCLLCASVRKAARTTAG